MQKRKASLLILTGGTCMSFVGLVMRLIEQADGLQILFYRSISLSLMVALVACLKRRTTPLAFLASLDRNDLAMGAALALAFATYIFAMLATSVASTLFILTASPFLAALIGWAWIGERPRAATWAAMAAAALGVGLMIGDGITTGRSIGNLTALFSAFMFALMLVLARRSGKADVLGGTFLGGVIAGLLALVCLPLVGSGLGALPRDIALALFMGAFTIGLGIALVTWGTPFVPAAEVSLLVLIESVLGPVWVWVFVGEAMSGAEMLGGGIVLAAVALVAARGGRRRRSGQIG
ncbi:MAG: DMT family transporter [Rhodobacteraceae bacterium]|nr:DMT family transporter [Paracoccaceae bacterium]